MDASAPPTAAAPDPSTRCGGGGGADQRSGEQHETPQAQPQPRLEVRPWHLASAIAAFDAAGDWSGAQELWGEALRRGVSPRSPGYDAVVSAALRAGDAAAARRLVEEARGLRLGLARDENGGGGRV